MLSLPCIQSHSRGAAMDKAMEALPENDTLLLADGSAPGGYMPEANSTWSASDKAESFLRATS